MNTESSQPKTQYIICLILYFFLTFFILGFDLFSFIITILLYSVGLYLILQGDSLFRYGMGARKLMTEEDENLKYIYQEVYETAREQIPGLKPIELYIVKGQGLKIEAITPHTMIISQLAIESFSEDELTALFASEFGRIAVQDVLIHSFVNYGNGIFSFALFLKTLIMNQKKEQKDNTTIYKKMGCTFAFLQIFGSICTAILSFLCLIGSIPDIIGRKRVFQADEYASRMGYSTELKEALYLLNKLSIANDSTHTLVDFAERIAKLEVLENQTY